MEKLKNFFLALFIYSMNLVFIRVKQFGIFLLPKPLPAAEQVLERLSVSRLTTHWFPIKSSACN